MPTAQLDESPFEELVESYMPEDDGRSDFSIDKILEEKGDINPSVQKPTTTYWWEYGRFKEDMWHTHMLREETTAWFQEGDVRTPDFIVKREFNGRRFIRRIKRVTDNHHKPKTYRRIGHEVDMMSARPEIPYIRRAPISLQAYVDLYLDIYTPPYLSQVFFTEFVDLEVPRYSRPHSNEEPQTRARVKGVKRPYDLEPKKRINLDFPVDNSKPIKNNPRLWQRNFWSPSVPREQVPPILKSIPWTYHAPSGKPGK